MRKTLLALAILALPAAALRAASLPEIPITPEWKARMTEKAPDRPAAPPAAKRKALLFSVMTGFKHWVTPHTAEIVKILGSKTGAYEVVETDDIQAFSAARLKPFDAVILNNTCSKNPGRNMFIDLLGADKKEEAARLEQDLIDFVAGGKGLIVLHGAITFVNSSEPFCDMIGGAFDFHPAQQEVTAAAVDPNHPLVRAFEGKPFVHVDEPYLFKGAYAKKAFRPLMVMDTSRLSCGNKTREVQADVRYIAWVRRHGQGRVFYCSPTHNAQSFDDPRLLRFMLDGFQYALGDLACDDSPLKR